MILKVVAETPEPAHGETMLRPRPAPNESSTRVIAQAATAPATMEGQDTPASDEPDASPGATTTVSIIYFNLKTRRLAPSDEIMCRLSNGS